MADCETGEFYFDRETGESLPLIIPNRIETLNFETGESEPDTIHRKRTTFKVPNVSMINSVPLDETTRQKNGISPILLFLLPTLFLYPVITIIPAFLEVLIHMWAHRKNKTIKNRNFYYKSPLHIYASEFCAKCREDVYMSKIGKIQDKRTMKYEYLKRFVS